MTADEVARELLIAFPPSPEVQAQELPIESKFGRIAYPKPAVLPIAPAVDFNDEQPPNRGDGKGRIESKLSESAIIPAAKTSPGVSRKTSTAHELLALFKAKAHTISDSPVAKTEPKLSQSTISEAVEAVEAVETSPGVTFSDHFLARYAPPCAEPVRFNADEKGQLNLLDFELPVVNEPPDPDDFSSIDAFNEAMAHWDIENPEPLTVSMDSMCEWAPVPDEWYEPIDQISPLNPPSMREVMELSRPIECSNTSDFSIPTFDAWCDRPNRQTDSDEPPDTGIFARLPKPRPPSFPPMSVVLGDRANSIKKFARSAMYLSGRGPPTPGGDAPMR
ncbi:MULTISPECIES: hypothetical protein [unclassified Microcoleus]|uniref:hypothetical protein n=1 Tax=unclassified Microcoleus TaxID=2642155 RepID=UPI002FD390F2